MSEAYWRYSNPHHQPPSSLPTAAGKRSRADYGLGSWSPRYAPLEATSLKPTSEHNCKITCYLPCQVPSDTTGGHELTNYFPRQDDRPVFQGIKSLDSINESYERYLHSSSARPVGVGIPGHSVNNPPIVGIGGVVPGPNINDRSTGFLGGRPNVPLPPDASNTLFVEGLPSSCTRREVAHIFRPFVGYKEVRLVTKESRTPGRDQVVLGFVDFVSPAHAATAMDALQGYKFDESDRDSVNLRLQFSRFPGARSGGGHRGKR